MNNAHSVALGYGWVIATVVMALLGDYFIKRAADSGSSLLSLDFSMGAAFYVASAAVWFLSLKMITLAQAGVAYAALTLVLVCLLSVVVFREPFNFKQGCGVFCALLAMTLMMSPTE